MPDFDDSAEYAVGTTGTSLNANNGVRRRWSEQVAASMRAMGLLDTMVDGTVAPSDQTVVWLDKNTDPAVLKYYEPLVSDWVQINQDWFRSGDFSAHILNTNNPHSVTAEQIGVQSSAYASRADAIAATVPDAITRISLMSDGYFLAYVRDDAETNPALTTNGGTRKWVPENFVTANHFGLAAGDSVGTANQDAVMTAAAFVQGKNKPVIILAGDYGLSARINIANLPRTVIEGIGAMFYPQGTQAAYGADEPLLQFWIDAPFSEARNLRFDGRDIIRRAVLCRGDYPKVLDCEFTRCGTITATPTFPLGYGVYVDGEQQDISRQYIISPQVRGCRFYDCHGAGVGFWAGVRGLIDNCQMERMGLEMLTTDRAGYDNVVSNCIGDDLCRQAGVGGIGIDNTDNWVVSNCVIRNTNVGALSGINVPGIGIQNNLGDTVNGTIVGCSISGCDGAIYARTTGVNPEGPGGTTTNLLIDGCNMFSNNGKSVEADAGTIGTLGDTNDFGSAPPSVPFTWRGTEVSFKSHLTTTQSNVTGNFSAYTVPFNVEVFDTAAAHSAGVFTAPRDGTYTFEAGVKVQGVAADHTDMEVTIVPVSAASNINMRAHTPTSNRSGQCGATVAGEFKLDEGDTVTVTVRVGGGADLLVCDLVDTDSAFNYFAGRLVSEAGRA